MAHSHCSICGLKLKSVIRPESIHYADMVCPKCGTHHGFQPWPKDRSGNKFPKPEILQTDLFKGGNDD